MTLRLYARFLREHWKLITGGALAGVIAAMALVLLASQKFTATSQLFLATPGYSSLGSLATTEASPYAADTFSQERARTYVRLATREDLARRVIERLHPSLTPDELVSATSASVQPDTVLIDVSVRSESPSKAAVLADAVASELIRDIRALELPGGVLVPNVDPVLVQPATTPTKPSSPNVPIYFVCGLTLGLLASVTAAACLGRIRRARGERLIEQITGRRVLATIDADIDKPGAPSQSIPSIVNSDDDGSTRVIAMLSPSSERFPVVTAAATLLRSLRGENPTSAVLIAIDRSEDGGLAAPQGSGLASVLAGEITLTEAITHDNGLDLLTGTGPSNWLPLLQSDQFRRVVEELRESYDVVLLHHSDLLSPPLAQALDVVDDGVLIATDGRITRGELAKAVRLLEEHGVELIGTVLLSSTSSHGAQPNEASVTSRIGV